MSCFDILEISKIYGGSSVYIPVYKKVIKGERNRQIIREFNGKNLAGLRLKYGISNQQLKSLLREGGVL